MTIDRCPVCGGTDALGFHRRSGVPVVCNVLCRTADAARAVPRAELDLVLCERCTMIWNRGFTADAFRYDLAYENSLHFSGEFQRYVTDLAASLRDRLPHGAMVVELGCGQGDFLQLVCRRPDLRGLGVDPAFRGGVDPSARVGCAVGGWEVLGPDIRADLVCARHVLEHLERPAELMATVQALLAGRAGGFAYLEVPDASYMLTEVALWDAIYEHPLYFTEGALRRLAGAVGLEVTSAGSSFGGQYLWVEAGAGRAGAARVDPASVLAAARHFDRRADAVLDGYACALAEAAAHGRRVALWGTGSKGTSFLNTVPGAAAIDVVVDVNPRKHGLHVPGTGQRISSPDDLSVRQVDDVIVLNPNYRTEVSLELDRLGVSSDLLVPA